MTNKLLWTVLVSIVLFAPSVQADGAPNQDITGRIAAQQGRIGRLQSNGKLSAENASAANNEATRISEEQQKMLTEHKGHLTVADRRRLNNRLKANAAFITNHTHGAKKTKQDDPLKF